MVSLEKLAQVTHFIKEIENALPVSRGPPPPSVNCAREAGADRVCCTWVVGSVVKWFLRKLALGACDRELELARKPGEA